MRVVVAGDIGQPGGQQAATARLARSLRPARVLAAGDLAYPNGSSSDFATWYQPTWGMLKPVTSAVPGNHEYGTPAAAGFRAYFGVSGDLWRTRRIGAWTLIMLDSERASSSAQLGFLRRALARDNGRPTVVMWHKPRYSSGVHGSDVSVAGLWRTVAVDPDVRLVLWGHDHDYERLQLRPRGRPVSAAPVVAMVVGTGGADLRCAVGARLAVSRAWVCRHGVLDLRLGPSGFSWAFVDTFGVRRDPGRRTL